MIEKVDMMAEMRVLWLEGGYDDRNVGTKIWRWISWHKCGYCDRKDGYDVRNAGTMIEMVDLMIEMQVLW